MKIYFPLFILFISPFILSAQNETCDNNNDDLLSDLNSITKCSIDNSTKTTDNKPTTKNVAVVVSSRRRVVRKRDVASGILNKTMNHKINNVDSKTAITETLALNSTNNQIIPFNFVEEIPVFKKCQSAPLLEQKKCFKKELSTHIKRNLKYPQNAYDEAIQGRVLVYFMINKDGSIGKMKVNAPYKGEQLGEEAERIIKKLPAFKPAKHNGSDVAVKYAVPITFKIPGVKASNTRKNIKKKITKVYTFAEVDKTPQFPTCNNSTSIACYNTELIKHIQDNFAYPQTAVDNNIEGIVMVKFVIDDRGNVINIDTKSANNAKVLETAAEILIKKLPKFSPATKNGNPVNVAYSFPVNFTLE